MLDWEASSNHCGDKRLPAPSLISHAVDENIGLRARIAPFPIVKFQTIVDEVMFSRLQIHESVMLPFSLLVHNRSLDGAKRNPANPDSADSIRATRKSKI